MRVAGPCPEQLVLPASERAEDSLSSHFRFYCHERIHQRWTTALRRRCTEAENSSRLDWLTENDPDLPGSLGKSYKRRSKHSPYGPRDPSQVSRAAD
jgi:hypothetical protein